MRIRWRGLELPSEVSLDESVCTETYGRFIIEPFERGFGTTIGNSLRRVLLSSIEGAAVSSVKISGASHEFMSLPGVMEDVTNIVLNIKSLVVQCDATERKTMSVTRDTKGEVRAGDIVADPAIDIYDPEHLLATLTSDVEFKIEMVVRTGRGYVSAAENASREPEIGVIPVDSVFSPIVRVRYRTEDTRVGQLTNYDRLILEVWTDGTIAPEDAVVEASKILRKHLNPFVSYRMLGTDMVNSPPIAVPQQGGQQTIDSEMEQLLSRPISDLELSVRAGNCLEAARVLTVGEVVQKSEAELLRLRSFGKTSLREVRRKLADWGLSLGMVVDGSAPPPPVSESPVLGVADISGPIGAPYTAPTSEVPEVSSMPPAPASESSDVSSSPSEMSVPANPTEGN
jgi:DNA-directed RNA polymerase subunit alpha